jgi:DNA-binding XRE family transcriptional regulator
MFNNGESRLIDFNDVLDNFKISRNSKAGKLSQASELRKASIENGTLSFGHISYPMKYKGKTIQVPFEIGADVLYKLSRPDDNATVIELGDLIRSHREKLHMTQDELPQKSGTTRTYISRLENNRSGIEVATLRKIVTAGLGKELAIKIK